MLEGGDGPTTEKKTPRKKPASSVRARTKTVALKRKAPTHSISKKSAGSPPNKVGISFGVGLVAVFVVSVVIGMSDDGQINVASTISQRASIQEASGDIEGSATTRAISSDSSTNKNPPGGGLVGRGNKITEQQKSEVKVTEIAPTTASSSEETASSTDESVVSDDLEENDESEIEEEIETSE